MRVSQAGSSRRLNCHRGCKVHMRRRLAITTERMQREGQHRAAIAPLAAPINTARRVDRTLTMSVIGPVARNSYPMHCI